MIHVVAIVVVGAGDCPTATGAVWALEVGGIEAVEGVVEGSMVGVDETDIGAVLTTDVDVD